MASPAPRVDTERVIDEVQRRPPLWDSTHDLYKDREIRTELWQEAFQSLFPDYKDFSTFRRKEIERTVHQRWKTARDAYSRCKNILRSSSGPVTGKKKVYIHYDKMKFLDKIHVSGENDCESQTVTTTQASSSGSPQILRRNFIKGHTQNPQQQQNVPVEIPTSVCGNPDMDAKIQRKRKIADRDKVDDTSNTLIKNAKALKNDDLCFFMSLLPITKEFTIQKKILFRSEILNKAMEILSMPTEQQPTCNGLVEKVKSEICEKEDSSNSSFSDPLEIYTQE